jgi:DNA mismatch endonuclease Vsr
MNKLTKEQRRKNMQAVRSSGSKIEKMMGKELWKRGCRYRKNDKSVFGKPDFVFKSLKIAVFCDSDFWHGKDWGIKKHEHKSNIEFWHKKIQRNIDRDREVTQLLKSEGWTVFRFWGSDIKKNLYLCVDKIDQVIQCKKSKSKQ